MSILSVLILSMIMFISMSMTALAQVSGEALQIPPIVQMQLNSYQERFQQILVEECPNGLCTAAGCEVTQFVTLDEQQDSSLPGLETPKEQTTSPQYRLVGVRCELAYESSLSNAALNSLKQRLQTKIKTAGTTLSLVLRKLSAKAPELASLSKNETAPSEVPNPETLKPATSLWDQLTPWMFFCVLLTLLSLLFIWGYRSIGKVKEVGKALLSGQPDSSIKETAKGPEPTAQMVIARVNQLKEKLLNSGHRALKPLLMTEDIDSLCQVLQHFGAEALAEFSKEIEFQETLKKLRLAFQEYPQTQSNTDVWNFLDKIDRLLIANELAPTENSLQEETAFLQTLEGDEFFHLLQRIPEEDLPLVLSFSPQHLQNSFFKKLDPLQMSNLLERITQAGDIPDQMVREKLVTLKRVYLDHRPELKRVSLDRTPLLEQLLNTMTPKDRITFVKQLQSEESGLVKGLMPNLFLDESLLAIPSETLNEIFLQVSPEKAAAYIDSLQFGEVLLQKLHHNLRQSIQRWQKSGAKHKMDLDFKMDDSIAVLEDATSNGSSNGVSTQALKLAEIGRSDIARGVREQVTLGQLNLQAINESIFQESRL